MFAYCRKLGLARAAGVLIMSDARVAARPNPRQVMHADYSQDAIRRHRAAQIEVGDPKCTYPWTVLLFVSAPGHLYVQLLAGTPVKVAVPAGCAVLFRGDVIHAGGAYQERHVRAHWYLVPEVTPYNGIRSPDDWRTNEFGEVALHEENLLRGWSNEHDDDTAFSEPAGVVFHTAQECSLGDALAYVE